MYCLLLYFLLFITKAVLEEKLRCVSIYMSESNAGMGCPIGQILRHKILNRHDIQIFVKETTVLNRNNMQKYHLYIKYHVQILL